LDHRIDKEKPNHTSPPPGVNWRNPRPLADIGTWIKRQLVVRISIQGRNLSMRCSADDIFTEAWRPTADGWYLPDHPCLP